jgi:hypothetical protein
VDSGLHELSVESAVFKPATTNFVLAPGQSQLIEISLEPRVSTLTLESLEGATVYLDGKKVSQKKLKLPGGNHTIRFKLGEYSVSKTFQVEEGKHYRLSLVFDIGLKED